MTPRASNLRCPMGLEDQAVLARRKALDSDQYRELSQHLSSCDVCRVTWEAAGAFDESGKVQAGDEEIVRRAVDLAMTAPRSGKRKARRRVLRPAVTACVLLAAGAAAAAAGGRIARYLELTQAALSTSASNAAPNTPVNPARSASHAAAVVEQPAPAPTSSATAAVPAGGSASAPIATPPSPSIRPEAALFARAKEARREGRTGEAIAAFRRLERDYPGSPEALVSFVSVGELLAAVSAWDAALESFDAYLRRAPSGPLAPEALAGKARVLARAGLGEANRP